MKEELQELLSQLPALYQATVDALQSLTPALNYYRSVIETNTGRLATSPCVPSSE